MMPIELALASINGRIGTVPSSRSPSLAVPVLQCHPSFGRVPACGNGCIGPGILPEKMDHWTFPGGQKVESSKVFQLWKLILQKLKVLKFAYSSKVVEVESLSQEASRV